MNIMVEKLSYNNFYWFSTKTYVVGTQNWQIRKYSQFDAPKMYLSGPMALSITDQPCSIERQTVPGSRSGPTGYTSATMPLAESQHTTSATKTRVNVSACRTAASNLSSHGRVQVQYCYNW